VSALMTVSSLAPDIEPSRELESAWEAEEEAVGRGDLDAAVEAVLDTWTLPDASPELRDRVAAMQRRALQRQAGTEMTHAPDPLEEDPEALRALGMPALVAVGERDIPDCHRSAEKMARVLPRARLEVIEGAGHLPPLETPDAFRELLLGFLR
jgi:3-oxoadipate enol-lactonase